MSNKYIGITLEIIYMDRAGRITQRSIEVHAIHNGLIRANCLATGQPRSFRTEQVLAFSVLKAGERYAS